MVKDEGEINHLKNLTDRGFSISFIEDFHKKHNISLAEMDASWGNATDYPLEDIEEMPLSDSAYEISPEVLTPLCAANVEIRPVNWLWRDVFMQGALNSIQGIAGVGKTFMLSAVVAAVSNGGVVQSTRGTMEKLKQGRVLYLSGDDDINTTLVPRLKEFGADLNNIFFAPDGKLPAIGSTELESLFESVKPSLCVLDTLQHFLPGKVDLNSANATTNALQPSKRLAEKYDCCIVVIQHISKVSASGNGGYSVNFGIGSAAVNGLFRSVWTLGRLRDEDGKPEDVRVLAPSKTNLVPGDLPCILFELTAERGFLWAGTDTDLTAEALYDPIKKQSTRKAPAREEAENFLRDILADGDRTATEIDIERNQAGISRETLNDAKKRLNVLSYQKSRVWYWRLDTSDSHTTRTEKHGNVGNVTRSEAQIVSDSLDSHTFQSANIGNVRKGHI